MKNLHEIKLRDHANDEIYTPTSLVKDLIKHIEYEPGQNFFDPFYGTGAFFNEFPQNDKNDYTEINLGKDFFKYTREHDWIVSNPPFSQLTKVIQHTLKLSVYGFAYLIPVYSLTCHRLKLINEAGFYLNKMVFFKNPKHWGIGFQMAFCIFTIDKSKSFVNLESSQTIQKRLF